MTSNHSTDGDYMKHFLSDRSGAPVSDLRRLSGGEFSRAYAYRQGDQNLVVRFSSTSLAFEKDRIAYGRCRDLGLPIAAILEIGNYANESYAISPLLPGTLVQDVDRPTALVLVPQLLDALHRIWTVDISASSGFGEWDTTGTGRYLSWHAAVGNTLDDNGGVLQGWHRAFSTGMLDQERYTALHHELQSSLDLCPEERCLLHGDFGFSNALTEGGQLSGILDWGLSLYGDPVYDIARMNFWAEAMPAGHIDWLGALKEYRHTRGLPSLENLDARLHCYELYHGLWHARHCALAKRPDGVAWALRKAEAAAEVLRAT
jgi:hygromycin-B 4-O-kinase